MTVEEVQKIIDEVDENGDGKLDYREVSNSYSSTVCSYIRLCFLALV